MKRRREGRKEGRKLCMYVDDLKVQSHMTSLGNFTSTLSNSDHSPYAPSHEGLLETDVR